MAYRNDSSNVDYRTGYTGKKEKVMRLLISKYRIRITSKIAELQDNIELLKSLL